MCEKKTLTIAIPTFNRNDVLNRLLKELVIQVKPHASQIQILIVDNASDIPVRESIDKSILELPYLSVRENRWNIGATANFLRCVELSHSQYLLWLGDDDILLVNYVESVMATIDEIKNKDIAFVNFNSGLVNRQADVELPDLSQFINKIDSIPNLVFISTLLLKVEVYSKYYFWANLYVYCSAGYLAPLLLSLSKANGSILLSRKYLVEYVQTPLHEKWSWVNYYLRLAPLLELPLGLDDSNFKKFQRLLFTSLPNLTFIFNSIILSNSHRLNAYNRFVFGQIVNRWGIGFRGTRQTWELLKLCMIARFPLALKFYIWLHYRVLGRPPYGQVSTRKSSI